MAIRQIYGTIGHGSEIISGEGFSCEKLQSGVYMVRFEKPFSKLPSAVCTVFQPPWNNNGISIKIFDITLDSFTCITSKVDHPVDSGFTFIVTGEE
ncbi:hypothetical protein [Crocosphaera sp.]|uniref:hypothetical protein n=1 Tax=Crocosphaera sp. TaxID=2729996 RepID=UPI002623612B|nr:hypothetical protein [Crocosphaera sp.]MDJ0580004.1 hypothetical protein [Crocosphaera sp.]